MRCSAWLDNGLVGNQDHIMGPIISHVNKVAIDEDMLNWPNFVSWVELGLITCKVICRGDTCEDAKNVHVIDIWSIGKLVKGLVEDFKLVKR